MVSITDETEAFNAVLNLACPDFDVFAKGKHPIPGIDVQKIFGEGPYGEERTAEQIFDWFIEEHRLIFNYVAKNQNNDDIFYAYLDYFRLGPGRKYKDFVAFCRDVDWYKLERQLNPQRPNPFYD